MNNKFIYTLYCAVWLVCCSLIVQGCTDEENVGATPDEGTLLRLSIADLEEVQVRGLAGESSAEYRTQCYDIFVYRGTDWEATPYYHSHREKYEEYVPGMYGDGSSSPVIDLGIAPQDGDRIYVFINCQWVDYVDGNTPENVFYGSDKLALSNARVVQFPGCKAFSGYIDWKNGQDNLIRMERLTAKVRVKITTLYTNKTYGGLMICNAPNYTLASNKYNGLDYEETGELIGVPFKCGPEISSGWYDEQPGVDIPEYRCSEHTALSGGRSLDSRVFDPQRMAVILVLNEEQDGNLKRSYYRLDFIDDQTLGYYRDVIRGHRYTFLITKIYSEGYATLEEAIYMPASNLEYTVTVNNDWTESFEYNGQWQLNIDREVAELLPNIMDPVPVAKVELQNNNKGTADFSKLTTRQVSLVSPDLEVLDEDVLGAPVPIQLWCYNPTTGQTVKAPGNVADASMLTGTSWVFCCTTDADFVFGGVLASCWLKIVMGNIVKYIRIDCLSLSDRFTEEFTELDKSDGGTANCYIVSPLGGTYSFNATVMGNGVKGITVANTFQSAKGSAYLTPGNVADVTIAPQSAKLLWQDKKGLISQVAYHDGRVEFIVSDSGQAGNAVIAVYDKPDPNAADATLLWSWHIWCAPRPVDIPVKPEAGAELVAGEKYIFMDRNVGAEDSKEVGMQYQYGRKDPFIDYETNGHEYIYDLLGKDVTALLKTVPNPPEQYEKIRFPLTYYAGIYSMDRPSTGKSNGLWGTDRPAYKDVISDDVKTIYDPCPPGYKVPDMRPYKVVRDKFFLTGKFDFKVSDSYVSFVSFQTSPRTLYFPNGGRYYVGERGGSILYAWTTGVVTPNESHIVFTCTYSDSKKEFDVCNMNAGIVDESFTQVRCISE